MTKPGKKRIDWRNPGPGLLIAAGLLLLAIKLILASAQQVYLTPEDDADLDDMLMYNGAVSIAGGDWLGAYGPLTLAKHSFFSLWLAGLHLAGVPYLLGGQLLWAAAALAAALAFAPVFKNGWVKLGLFAVLLFSPASTANPAPLGYITRVYRDNIFPALCLLVVAGMAGFALRLWKSRRLHSGLGWLVLAGLALAACWLCREDGWWMLIFAGAAAVVCGWFILRGGAMLTADTSHSGVEPAPGEPSPLGAGEPLRGAGVSEAGRTPVALESSDAATKPKKPPLKTRLLRACCLLLPFVLLAAGLLSWSAANNAAYGRFIVSDFSGGEFADAYGAMTRIEHEHWDPKVDVPRDVRQKLYAALPEFARLEPLLEGEYYLGHYAGWTPENPQADYSSGAFYWALRAAAAELGVYDSPQTAKAYFEKLAADINALCDDGALPAGARRSSVSPPIRAAYVGPVLAEGMRGLWLCATFGQCDARSLWSPRSNDPILYSEKIAPMEAFLHDRALTATLENSDAPYYTPLQKLQFGLLDVVRYVYAVLTPLALAASLVWLAWFGVKLAGKLKKREQTGFDGLLWLMVLGLWLCILLRAAMIAFAMVSSFDISTYVMYLASIHPLMLLAAYVGTARLVKLWREKRAAKGEIRPPAKTGVR